MDELRFSDDKEPGALRTIGEVAQALGLKPHVLRYWEEQFPSLQPVKRSGGRRYYRPEDMVLILRISNLVHGKGYTLRGARAEIESTGGGASQPVLHKATEPASEGAETHTDVARSPGPSMMARLRQIRDALRLALDEDAAPIR